MFPNTIKNCEHIRIKLRTNQDTYFFRTAGALTHEPILSLSVPFGSNDSGYYPEGETVIPPSLIYITLIDTDGNVLYNNLPGSAFSSNSIDLIRIGRVIDWERSYIKIAGSPFGAKLDDMVFSCNVFSGSAFIPAPKLPNYYSIEIPVMPGEVNRIEFTNRLNALKTRKIYGVVFPQYVFGKTSSYLFAGSISLYSRDHTRFFERMNIDPLLLRYTGETTIGYLKSLFDNDSINLYIEPTVIDFERSYMEVFVPANGLNFIKLVFIYE